MEYKLMNFEQISNIVSMVNESLYKDVIITIQYLDDEYYIDLYCHKEHFLRIATIQTNNLVIRTLYFLLGKFDIKYISLDRITCLSLLVDIMSYDELKEKVLYELHEKELYCNIKNESFKRNIKCYGIIQKEGLTFFESTLSVIEDNNIKEMDFKYYFNNPDKIKELDQKSKERLSEIFYNSIKYLAYWIEETHPSLDDIMNKIWEE